MGSQRDVLEQDEGIDLYGGFYESNSPLDYSEPSFKNGIGIYPYWIVMEKETGLNGVKIKAYQLHNLIPVEESTFNAGMWAFGGDEEEAPIYGNTILVALDINFLMVNLYLIGIITLVQQYIKGLR